MSTRADAETITDGRIPMHRARHKLVFIEWVDSHRTEGWHRGDSETEPLLCYSAGWLIHDGETAKTIAAHVTIEDEPQRCGEITIPTCCIRKIIDIEV